MDNTKVCFLHRHNSPEYPIRIDMLLAHLSQSLPSYSFITLPKIMEGMVPEPLERDISSDIENCDLVLALLDQPSADIGLAIGMALYNIRRPVLLISFTTTVIEERLRRLKSHRDYQGLLLHVAVANQSEIAAALTEAAAHFKIGGPKPQQLMMDGIGVPDAAFAPPASTSVLAGYQAELESRA